jgi:Tat protein translocase TatB subunit
MFGLGFSEVLILAVLGLVLLGPDQLPEVARTLGRFFNDLKRSTDEITDEFKKSTMSSNNLLEDIRNDLNNVDQGPTDYPVPDHTTSGHTDGYSEEEPVQLEMDTDYVEPQQVTELEKNGKKPESN